MGKLSTPVFTSIFSGSTSHTFLGTEGYNKISVQRISGSPTITGTGKLGSLSSSAITLSDDLQGLTLIGDDQIAGVTIDAAGGEVAVVCNS
jgi:hypothetical protein